MEGALSDTVKKYKVKSKFIKLLIDGGHYNEKIYIDGYTNQGHVRFARFALEKLTRYAFNIQRFPGYEDRMVFQEGPGDSFNHFNEWIDFFENKISESEIEESVEDIINIYNHIQEQLKDKTVITCYRGLQPHEYLQIINKLDTLQPEDSISYRTSTIVSFRKGYTGYSNRLTIKVDIPVKNILMHYGFIETEQHNFNSYYREGLTIENEILYINDNKKAMFTLNRKDILNWGERNTYYGVSDIAKNYQMINHNSNYESLFYDQVYLVHLRDYKKCILGQLSPRFRKKVKKELEYI